MQMWLTTHSTSDPVVEVRGEFYWVTPMGGSRFLVTRQRDATRVGVFSLSGGDIHVEDGNAVNESLIREISRAAKARGLVRAPHPLRNLVAFWWVGRVGAVQKSRSV